MIPIVVSSYRRIVVSSYRRRTVVLRPHCRADRDWLLTFLELFALEPIADFSKTRIQFAKGSAPATSTYILKCMSSIAIPRAVCQGVVFQTDLSPHHRVRPP